MHASGHGNPDKVQNRAAAYLFDGVGLLREPLAIDAQNLQHDFYDMHPLKTD
jgi:hypothetical protein